MNAAEVTLYRCYWPPAFHALKARGATGFSCQAYDLLMTVELAPEHARALVAELPAGAVVGTILLEPLPLHAQNLDELLFAPQAAPYSLDKN